MYSILRTNGYDVNTYLILRIEASIAIVQDVEWTFATMLVLRCPSAFDGTWRFPAIGVFVHSACLGDLAVSQGSLSCFVLIFLIRIIHIIVILLIVSWQHQIQGSRCYGGLCLLAIHVRLLAIHLRLLASSLRASLPCALRRPLAQVLKHDRAQNLIHRNWYVVVWDITARL